MICASAGDVDRACIQAAEAFRDYSRRSGAERAQLLRRVAQGIEDLGDPLIDCVMRETALPRARIVGERTRTCMQLRLFATVPGHAVGVALVGHPLIRAGAFTGSQQGGLALLRAAQARPQPIPFFAEMGSVNPVFLHPAALAARSESIAVGLHASLTLGVGQFCTQPGVIFMVRGELTDAFLKRLAALVGTTPPGTMLTKGMQTAYEHACVARCALPGVTELARAVGQSDSPQVAAALFSVDVETFLAASELSEEIFGPSSLVVLCRDVGDFSRCARHLPGQLTATVHAESADADLLWELEQKAGRLIYNGFPTGVEVGTAMVHGGPFPSTSDSRFTSVGTRSLYRFVRPVAYQGFEP